MLDNVSRYASAISLAAVAILSIFNIGYFWKIGLHFLGLIDLTNLVYSFGLSLAALFLTGSIGAFVFRRSSSLFRIIAALGVGGALSLWGMIRFSPRTLDPELVENGAILIGFVVSGAAFFGLMRQRHQGSGKWDWRDLAALVFCGFAAIGQAGAKAVFNTMPTNATLVHAATFARRGRCPKSMLERAYSSGGADFERYAASPISNRSRQYGFSWDRFVILRPWQRLD